MSRRAAFSSLLQILIKIALLYCFRIPVNLITDISIKPRRGIQRKKGGDWVMRGEYSINENNMNCENKLTRPKEVRSDTDDTTATGDALNHCCWGVVLIPNEEKNIGVSR